MKFSEQWLRTWVNPELDRSALVEQLSLAGLEVDGVEPVAGVFSGVVVGEIVHAEKHPDADKLQVCHVNVGEAEPLNIVCGAKNARQGIKVAVAQVGAVLPGDFKIKKAKLRGVPSFGMICSESELGLADSSDGIMELPSDAPIGTDIRIYLHLDDATIDIDLTSNRGDCLSLKGLAREVGALNTLSVTEPVITPVSAVHDQTFPVTLAAPEACPKYVCRVIKNIDPQANTPLEMVERLRRSGIRSISPVVDVTNYVMLTLGQPMHGFDLAKVTGDIHVRMAKEGEQLTLLDGQEVTCQNNTLLIADAKGPLALAGIMGGETSGVTDATQDVLLESAFFAPLAIMGRPRQYGLHTDSSLRFERGVDPSITEQAIEHATQLLLDIVGGEPGPMHVTAKSETMPCVQAVSLRQSRLSAYLGIEIDLLRAKTVLESLGMTVISSDAQQLAVNVPLHRFDISKEVDLIEEVARIVGYDHIPAQLPNLALQDGGINRHVSKLQTLKTQLQARGFHEAITYSFISPKLQQTFFKDRPAKVVSNPIAEELSVMRTALIPGLVQAAAHNLQRQQTRLRLFETGRVFKVDSAGALTEKKRVALLISGQQYPEQWQTSSASDFYALKQEVTALLANVCDATDITLSTTHLPGYAHPGQAAEVKVRGTCIGVVGRLHPTIEKTLKIKQPIYVAELNADALLAEKTIQAAPISKFPAVRRDIAVEVKAEQAVAPLCDAIRQQAGDLLEQVVVFDVYQGDGVPDGHKSVALGIVLRAQTDTLTDAQVSSIIEGTVEQLHKAFGAQLRT